jgi:site-specific recombinase XerD
MIMKTDLGRFVTHLKRRYPNRSTTKHYISDLNIFARFVKHKPPQKVTINDIDAFVEKQSNQQLKPATINRRLAAISSFFQFLILEAEEDGWRNPVCWKRHSIRQGHHLPRDVKDDQAETLWSVIEDPRDQAMIALMLKAGLRVGEVVMLNVTVVEGPGSDRLARLKVRGKGDKERMVWLTSQTWLYLHYWLQIRPESQSQALFLNQHNRRLSVSGVQYRLKQYCQQAGVEVACHQLRHTFARRLAEQNMPLDSLAKLLGHNDLHTTQGYIDGANLAVKDDFLAAIEKLDAVSQEAKAQIEPISSLPFQPAVPDKRPDSQVIMDKVSHYGADLPNWLRPSLEKHTRRRLARWTAHQVEKRARYHHNVLSRICQWLVQERNWQQLADLKRADLVAYVHVRQEAGLKPGSIRAELTLFRGFWRDLLEQEVVTNGAVLQVHAPAPAEHLPRYLTGDEFQRLEAVIQTETSQNGDDDYFNRAWFYLLAHGGLRISEALNLRLGDCDFHQNHLRIRSGKGDRDRVIPMTAFLKQTLIDYLIVRQSAATDHLLMVHGRPALYGLVRGRLLKFGKQANISDISLHRLRHTLATFLINEGMPIVSLQKFLGHKDINETLVYAKVHNATVREQFASAMKQIEAIAKTAPVPLIIEEAMVETPSLPDGSLTIQPSFSAEKENVSLFTDSV